MNRVRFAPSPTGSLHVGNALSAVANRDFGDWLLLRIDDTDPGAKRPRRGGGRARRPALARRRLGRGPGAPELARRAPPRRRAGGRTAAALRGSDALARRRLADVPPRERRRRHGLRDHARDPRLGPPAERGAARRAAPRARARAAAGDPPRPRRRRRRQEALEARRGSDGRVAARGRVPRRGGARLPRRARAAAARRSPRSRCASVRSRSTCSRLVGRSDARGAPRDPRRGRAAGARRARPGRGGRARTRRSRPTKCGVHTKSRDAGALRRARARRCRTCSTRTRRRRCSAS